MQKLTQKILQCRNIFVSLLQQTDNETATAIVVRKYNAGESRNELSLTQMAVCVWLNLFLL